MKPEKIFFIGLGLLCIGIYLRSRSQCGSTCKIIADGFTRKGLTTVLGLI